jgi:hypothetical protein
VNPETLMRCIREQRVGQLEREIEALHLEEAAALEAAGLPVTSQSPQVILMVRLAARAQAAE